MPEPKSKFLFVKLEPWQHAAIAEGAAMLGQSMSDFARLTLLAEVERRLLATQPSTDDATT